MLNLKQLSSVIVVLAGMSVAYCFAVLADEPLQPVPKVDMEELRFIEGSSYCSAGYGNQKIVFNIGDKKVYSDEDSNTSLPKLELIKTTFLKINCVIKNIVIDYSLINDSAKFNENVQFEGTTYNSIKFQYDVLMFGYSIDLIPNRLYFDLGVGYAQTQYYLGYYGSTDTTGDYKSDTLNDINFVYHISLKYHFNSFFYIHWQNQQSADSDSPISYSNQLGLNFLVKF